MTFAEDAGEYCVFAKNPLGEVSASARLLEEGTHPRTSHNTRELLCLIRGAVKRLFC